MVLNSIDSIEIIDSLQQIIRIFSMHTWSSNFHQNSCPKLNQTASTWAASEHRDYLANVNYKLINEINQSETEKHFYKHRLNEEFRSHQNQLEQAFKIISQKNLFLINLEEEMDRCKKQHRSMSDQYIILQRNAEEEKQYSKKQMENMKLVCKQKVKKIEQESEAKYELKIRKRVQEVENECEDRIKMYKGQVSQLTENSTQLTHELRLIQEDYRQMLLKNDTIIQQSIHRELRKRDFEAQNNYLSDLAQYEAIKKEKSQLKEQLGDTSASLESLKKQHKILLAKLEVMTTRGEDLENALQNEKKHNKVELFEKYKDTQEYETNTEQQFVPIVMPIDLNIVSEIVSLKQFLVEKVIERFMDFFNKTANTESKKTSKSLITFKNSLDQLKSTSSDLKIILFLHSSVERIVKVYCPAMTYSRQFLTIKDQFIRKTLMECETIGNHPQKLYRILELLFRIKNPLNHLHAEITTGELRLVEMKLMSSLKKIFTS